MKLIKYDPKKPEEVMAFLGVDILKYKCLIGLKVQVLVLPSFDDGRGFHVYPGDWIIECHYGKDDCMTGYYPRRPHDLEEHIAEVVGTSISVVFSTKDGGEE